MFPKKSGFIDIKIKCVYYKRFQKWTYFYNWSGIKFALYYITFWCRAMESSIFLTWIITNHFQRLGSVRGEDLPYIFGLPLVLGMPNFSQNFSRQDMGVAEAILNFVTNFCKTGDPNEAGHQQVISLFFLYKTFVCLFPSKFNKFFFVLSYFSSNFQHTLHT